MIDDEVPVELEAGHEQVERPRRWPLAALLAAIVAVLVLVGRLDSHERAVTLPTTTTTTRATTTTRGPPTTLATTTTSLPSFDAGAGPLLPGADGTYLVSTHGDGLLTVTDLGTGARCTNRRGDGAWFMRGNDLRGRAAVQTTTGAVLVGPRCELTQLTAPDGQVVATGETTAWVIESGGTWLAERFLDGSRGRSVDLPQGSSPTVAVVSDGVVVGINGSMTLVDRDGRRRDLGPGEPVAAHDHTLAFTTCPSLRCSLVLLDLLTGARRTIDPSIGAATVFGPAGFSPDGRYLATSSGRGAAVVDVATGRKTTLDSAPSIVGFTADSRWVIVGSAAGRVLAIALEGDAETVDLQVTAAGPDSGLSAIVLLAPTDY